MKELEGKERRLEFENRKQEIMIKMLEKQNEATKVAVAELTVVRDLEEGLDGVGVELEEAEEEREEEEEEVELEEDGSIYCLCQQVSSGKMVACENQDCPLAWFHFGCVGLQGKVVLPTMQASLSARKLGYWEIRGCCGRRWRDVNLKTPIYYKYYV